MRTNTFIKALAFAMLLATACNKNEIANEENTEKKGFSFPVTVNVTREGDDATKATFNDGTKKLSFSEGDILFVGGQNTSAGAGYFDGALDYDAVSGKFSGTITTQFEYTGTADELFTAPNYIHATLLPKGYEDYGYLYIEHLHAEGYGFEDCIGRRHEYTFATSKAAAVEQFSFEQATSYSSGFALEPKNAILNFTITGFLGNSKVDVSLTGSGYTITKTVTTDNSGNAKFAVGIGGNYDLNNFTLTAGVKAVTIVDSSTPLVKGKIYNITRSATATTLSELKTAIDAGKNCSCYTGWEVNSAGAIAANSVSGTKIGYVAYVSTSDVDAGVSGSRILVIASADASATALTWGSYGTARGLEAVENANDLNGYSNTNTLQGYGSEAHPAAYAAWNYSATIPSGGATPAHWFMPAMKQWKNMRDAKGGTYGAMATAYGISGHYWTSNEFFNGEDYNECKNYAWRFVTNSGFAGNMKSLDFKVRSIFAY